MKIVPNAVHTPVTTPTLLQTQKADPAPRSGGTTVLAPSVAHKKPEATVPYVVNVLGSKLELQPNELAKMVDKMNETARIFNHAMRFEVGEGHRIRVQIVDVTTGEVVRDIPPDKFMDSFIQMQNAVGMIFDERV
jgi:flagellar protein FlaG